MHRLYESNGRAAAPIAGTAPGPGSRPASDATAPTTGLAVVLSDIAGVQPDAESKPALGDGVAVNLTQARRTLEALLEGSRDTGSEHRR